jgi:hypothetical protein
MTKYELKNRKGVHANFFVEDGVIVKTDPILCWINGLTLEFLREYCMSGNYRRMIITEVEE